jgi:hypothetical protein
MLRKVHGPCNRRTRRFIRMHRHQIKNRNRQLAFTRHIYSIHHPASRMRFCRIGAG